MQPQKAQVAELVDAHVSGACAARREGSSPFLGTAKSDNRLKINGCRAFVLWVFDVNLTIWLINLNQSLGFNALLWLMLNPNPCN